MRVPERLAAAALLIASLTACAQFDVPLGDVGLPRGNTAVVHGEVRSVDTRSGRIQVRQDGGGNRTIRYDRETNVVHRNQRYPVSALERGDRVAVRLVFDRRGEPVADRIEVRESARDRGVGRAGRSERVEGRVSWVDNRSGSFGLDLRRSSITVHSPRNLSRSDRQRLDRLRRGSDVRVEVRPLGRNQYELVRFR
jgi:hypothetical protein